MLEYQIVTLVKVPIVIENIQVYGEDRKNKNNTQKYFSKYLIE